MSRQKLQFCAYREDEAISFEDFLVFIQSESVDISIDLLKSHYLISEKEAAAFHFQVSNREIMLCINKDSIKIDLNQTLSQKAQILRREGAKNQLIYKALGSPKFKEKLRVLDATAGFADDTCWFLALGADVVMSERNPLLFCLLANALKHFRIPNNCSVKLVQADSSQVEQLGDFDTIYYDPFFQKKKSAKAKKNMEIIGSHFHNDDLDAVEVAQDLLKKCKGRLIIKRSDKAPRLIDKPTYEIKGKTVRFDIYYRG